MIIVVMTSLIVSEVTRQDITTRQTEDTVEKPMITYPIRFLPILYILSAMRYRTEHDAAGKPLSCESDSLSLCRRKGTCDGQRQKYKLDEKF